MAGRRRPGYGRRVRPHRLSYGGAWFLLLALVAVVAFAVAAISQ